MGHRFTQIVWAGLADCLVWGIFDTDKRGFPRITGEICHTDSILLTQNHFLFKFNTSKKRNDVVISQCHAPACIGVWQFFRRIKSSQRARSTRRGVELPLMLLPGIHFSEVKFWFVICIQLPWSIRQWACAVCCCPVIKTFYNAACFTKLERFTAFYFGRAGTSFACTVGCSVAR